MDFALLLCTLAATVVGIIMVYSATTSSGSLALSLGDPAVKQTIFAVVGLTLMLIITRFDYRFLESFTLIFYIVTLGLLLLVMVQGVISFGSQRWLNLGFIPIQPSELAKLSLIVMLAHLLSNHEKELGKL